MFGLGFGTERLDSISRPESLKVSTSIWRPKCRSPADLRRKYWSSVCGGLSRSQEFGAGLVLEGLVSFNVIVNKTDRAS